MTVSGNGNQSYSSKNLLERFLIECESSCGLAAALNTLICVKYLSQHG